MPLSLVVDPHRLFFCIRSQGPAEVVSQCTDFTSDTIGTRRYISFYSLPPTQDTSMLHSLPFFSRWTASALHEGDDNDNHGDNDVDGHHHHHHHHHGDDSDDDDSGVSAAHADLSEETTEERFELGMKKADE